MEEKENLTNFEEKILSILRRTLDTVVFILIIAVLGIIFLKLYELFFHEFFSGNIDIMIDSVLYTVILIELFTILFSYLKKRYIKVERIVEVGIIAIVREVMFNLFEIELMRIYALSALLLVLGGLFFVEKYFSKKSD